MSLLRSYRATLPPRNWDALSAQQPPLIAFTHEQKIAFYKEFGMICDPYD